MNLKFTKSFMAGAIVLGISASGATVWAATNESGKGQTQAVYTTSSVYADDVQTLLSNYSKYVTSMSQKIDSAVQSNDLSRAQSLSSIANQELHQINALIASGQTQTANQTLLTDVNNLNSSTTASVSSTRAPVIVTPVTSNTTSTNVSHNTTALVSALQHVKNPKAQQALENNIEKGFLQLADKLQLQKAQSLTNSRDEKPSTDGSITGSAAPVSVSQTTTTSVSVEKGIHAMGKTPHPAEAKNKVAKIRDRHDEDSEHRGKNRDNRQGQDS